MRTKHERLAFSIVTMLVKRGLAAQSAAADPELIAAISSILKCHDISS